MPDLAIDYHRIEVVGLDCDDTLWHSEDRFQDVHARYRELLRPHVDPTLDDDAIDAAMLATERANLRLFGYGAKGFVLSLVETAITLTERRIDIGAIETILGWGKDLLDHPIELLDGVEETVRELGARGYRILLITKGDLWHQEAKVAASGLAERADSVEIVSEKDPATYRRVLDRHGVDPGTFCMVGNSVRSDVLPILEIGGTAVHVPYRVTWEHERVDASDDDRFEVLDRLDALLDRLPPAAGTNGR